MSLDNSGYMNAEILAKSGLYIVERSKRAERLFVISWPDRSIRWMFKSQGTRLGFLAFYPASTLRARVGVLVMQLISLCGLIRFMANVHHLDLESDGVISKALKKFDCDAWSLFGGTPGDDRKVVVALYRGRKVVKYLKIPISTKSIQLVEKEYKNVKALGDLNLKRVIVPNVEQLGEVVVIENVNGGSTITTSDIMTEHLTGLAEVFSKTEKKMSLSSYIEQRCFAETARKIRESASLGSRLDSESLVKISNTVIQYLDILDKHLGDTILLTSASHKDFTPWNSFVREGKLVLIDFELAELSGVAFGHDLIHYFVQQKIMTKQDISRVELVKLLEQFSVMLSFSLSRSQLELYANLYFISQMSRYIPLYQNSNQVHEQAHWQVEVWYKYCDHLNVS